MIYRGEKTEKEEIRADKIQEKHMARNSKCAQCCHSLTVRPGFIVVTTFK
jgi:hypothetical protein